MMTVSKTITAILAVGLSIAQAKESRIGPRLQPGVPRIIGGSPVTDSEEGRWVCSLQDKWYGDFHLCGCNIIDERTMLTAAHCISPGWHQDYEIYCGTNDLTGATVTSLVTNIIRHEGYDSNTLVNDQALMKLATPMVFGADTMKNVVLPTNPEVCAEGTSCQVYGWGVTSEGGGSTPVNLMKTQVDIIPMSVCQEKYAAAGIDVDNATMICAAAPNHDSCQGDSGGPLLARGNVLCGTVSWGIGCARPEYPGVYARVSTFLKFITDCSKDKCLEPACETCCE